MMRKFTKESTTYFVRGPVCRGNTQKNQNQVNMNVKQRVSSQADGKSKYPGRAALKQHG